MIRKTKFQGPIPNPASETAYCKYSVVTSVGGDDQITDHSTSGYIEMQFATENFNKTIYLIVQPWDKFEDNNAGAAYEVSYGDIFFFPAEYKGYITVSASDRLDGEG